MLLKYGTMTVTKRLGTWEEASGLLLAVVEAYPYLTLDFGDLHVIIRSEEANSIKGILDEKLIGKRISVLRTDLHDEPILVREHLDRY